jgi:hypothetical protein
LSDRFTSTAAIDWASNAAFTVALAAEGGRATCKRAPSYMKRSSMPLKRMLEGRNFDSKAVAIIVQAFNQIIDELDLRTPPKE